MELTSSTSTGTLDTDTQTPPSFTNTNGFLNRRRNTAPSQPPSAVVSYKECLRNHAASLGGHALDGCGEFMPSLEPRSLTCAACGCHRNFHRRDTQEIFPNPSFLSFYPSLPPQLGISPNTSPSPSPNTSPSPPQVSNSFPSSYHRHNSATHVLLSLGNGYYDGVKRRCLSFVRSWVGECRTVMVKEWFRSFAIAMVFPEESSRFGCTITRIGRDCYKLKMLLHLMKKSTVIEIAIVVVHGRGDRFYIDIKLLTIIHNT